MSIFRFESTQELPASVDEVFPFFADATNLERITPPWLRFRVVSPVPIEMGEGTRIDYRLRLRGIPIRWRSEITDWDPPRRFVDRQLKGPYRLWIHTHTFTPSGNGTLVQDEVEYAVPGGALVNRFLVRGDVERIFEYRTRALADLFASS
jgi:ligand-binding SRPBCC domain-containing protein